MALNSTSTIKVLDLLCEGPIDGIVGQEAGVYLNETPILSSSGERNFPQQDINYEYREGTATQTPPSTAPGVTSTVNEINTEVGKNYEEDLNVNDEVIARRYGGGTVIRQITDTDVDAFQILFTVPRLFSIAKEGLAQGQAFSATIGIIVQVQARGQGYNTVYTRRVTGVSTTSYQFKTPRINLTGSGPWNIKVIKEDLGEDSFEVKYTSFRDTPQNVSVANDRGNQLLWTGLIEEQYIRTGYPFCAVTGLSVSTRQFDSLPTRAYLIRGRRVMIPSNATVLADGSLQFDGSFDGSLRGPVWTTCPVCCFYDMLTNGRYGAGDFVTTANLSWIDLYPLARYANQQVTNPDGTTEPRFACNVVIGDQAEAYNVLQDIASVFRGLLYWSADVIQAAADHGNLDGTSLTPVHLYNNANVIDGVFEYSGSSLKTRSTSVRVRYNDPENFYKSNYVVVEDSALITKYGYQVKEIVAFGCTSKWQAQRVGRWVLKTEELDGETITFTTGLQGAVVLPGQIFAVADQLRQGQRISGRISSVAGTAVVADQTVTLPSGSSHQLTCLLPDGTLETRAITSIAGSTINITSAFSQTPQAQALYSITSTAISQQKFRCISIADNGDGQFSITGLVHNDSLYAAVEENINLVFGSITTYDDAPPTPTGLTLSSRQIFYGANIYNRITASWTRAAEVAIVPFSYEVRYKVGNGNFVRVETTDLEFYIDGVPANTEVIVEVIALGQAPLKKKSPATTASLRTPADNSGTITTLPPDPFNVRIEAYGNDQVMLRWDRPPVFNNYEYIAIIRHSNKTDGTGEWAQSTLISESITANTAQAILPFVEGEYLIKFQDKTGLRSVNAVSATIDLPNPIPRYTITTVREDFTNFAGQNDGTFYSDDYDGLVLDGTYFIDDEIREIDTWDSFDFVGPRRLTGNYYFSNVVDLGGNYSVVYSRILAARGLYPSATIDSRTAEIDRWSDFDGDIPDDTSAEIYLRTSSQPTSNQFTLLEDGNVLLMEDQTDLTTQILDPITTQAGVILSAVNDGSRFELESDINFGPWIPMRAGRYTGRQFQFKCELTSTANDQTPIVEELGYVMQLESRTERSATIASGTTAKVVTYTNAFYEPPALGITAFNLSTGDYYEVTFPSRTGFTVTFRNSAGTIVDRNFQYQAAGYGALV